MNYNIVHMYELYRATMYVFDRQYLYWYRFGSLREYSYSYCTVQTTVRLPGTSTYEQYSYSYLEDRNKIASASFFGPVTAFRGVAIRNYFIILSSLLVNVRVRVRTRTTVRFVQFVLYFENIPCDHFLLLSSTTTKLLSVVGRTDKTMFLPLLLVSFSAVSSSKIVFKRNVFLAATSTCMILLCWSKSLQYTGNIVTTARAWSTLSTGANRLIRTNALLTAAATRGGDSEEEVNGSVQKPPEGKTGWVRTVRIQYIVFRPC